MKIKDACKTRRVKYSDLKPGAVFQYASGTGFFLKLNDISFWCLDEDRFGTSLPSSNETLVEQDVELHILGKL